MQAYLLTLSPETAFGPGKAQLLELVTSAHTLLGSNKLTQMRHQDLLVNAIRNFSRTLQGQTKDIWGIVRTHSRGYAALLTGPSSVGMQLRDLWNTADGGAGLVSATLYAINEDGEYRCDYLRMVLSLPIARVDTPTPVREKHITELPTLHTPSPAMAAMLIPPSQREDEQEALWQARLAKVVAMVHRVEAMDFVASVGADVVLPLTDGWREAALAATDGRGVDLVVDPVGGDAFDDAIRVLAPEGRLLVQTLPTGNIWVRKLSLKGVLAIGSPNVAKLS